MQQHRREETAEQRERRLLAARIASAASRHQNASGQMTSHHYLLEEGWVTSRLPHYQQPWVSTAMQTFHSKQNKWEQRLCMVCHEVWPTRTCLDVDQSTFVCTRCKRDKGETKRYSNENDMWPGEVPACLQGLSQVEEMLIARACPIMCVFRKHGGQRGYRGHVLNLPQDIQGFLDRLPCNVNDLPVLLLRRYGEDNTHTELRVRRSRILSALQWLQQNNPFYCNIIIDQTALQRLPDGGVPPDLLVAVEGESEDDPAVGSVDMDMQSRSSHSFLPLPNRTATEDEAIRAAVIGADPLDWPNIRDHPMNEFRTPGLATQAFPALFPYGTGDPTCLSRQRPVTFTEAFKHLIRYADEVDGTFLWRFSNHPRFPYWALNMKLRHQLLSQATVYLHQYPADAQLTTENLRDMVGHLSAEQLMQRLQRYAAKIQGSNQYWYQRYSELRALIEHKGPPTFFWTVSSADNYWPELHNLMPHPHNTQPSHAMRMRAVIDNPHLTDWFFTSKLSDWVQHWLYDALGAEWHWYRYEYQARGSTHAHGCAKLTNDPGICQLVEKAATAWAISEEDSNDSDNGTSQFPPIDEMERAQILLEGDEAKAAVLQYANWLVTTCNDTLPDESWTSPDPHPCAVSVQDVADSDDDYHNLVNSVERHTRCSAAYCLRKKPGEPNAQCRFNYPRPTQAESSITFERLGDGTIRATLTTQRNDPRLNSHNRLLLQNWRANVDLQIIIDSLACARYLAKYAAKGEPRSQGAAAVFKACVGGLRDDSDPRSALRSAMIRAVGERDFSAQETAHMLLSLPLVSCTFSFITLSLTGDRRIVEDAESGQLVVQQSLFDHYCNRTTNLDVSLLQFAAEFSVYKGEVKRRPSPVIVRTFPHYSSNPHGENYELYCKYQLVRHKPWHGVVSNAWGSIDSSPADWVAEYHRFLLTDTARENIPHFSQELHLAEQRLALEEDSDDDDEVLQRPERQDEWMQLCQLHPHFNTPSGADNQVDWAASARQLPPDLLRECPKWISSQHRLSDNNPESPWQRQLPPVDISTLNAKQHQAYDIIRCHYAQLTAGNEPTPIHMIVSGTAGTGKSYLISAMAQLLKDSCLLTGTTGMASFNICGKTVHSALQLPVHRTSQHTLQGPALQRLQLRLKHKHYIIIDEMSMMGLRMLALVDKRLRQATGKLDSPLGGFTVILFGDFGQLPPVGDRPLYADPTTSELSLHGHHIYHVFNTVVVLEQVLRQRGTDPETLAFRELLMRLRDGTTTQEDWRMLLQRTPQQASNCDEFADAVRLYYDKASVAQYNLDKLQSLGTPIARITAIHSNKAAATAKSDDAGGLYPMVFLAAGA